MISVDMDQHEGQKTGPFLPSHQDIMYRTPPGNN